jgi:hypothetical protein
MKFIRMIKLHRHSSNPSINKTPIWVNAQKMEYLLAKEDYQPDIREYTPYTEVRLSSTFVYVKESIEEINTLIDKYYPIIK